MVEMDDIPVENYKFEKTYDIEKSPYNARVDQSREPSAVQDVHIRFIIRQLWQMFILLFINQYIKFYRLL